MASDDGYDPHHAYAHHHQAAQGHTHSRLSICSSSFTCSNDEDGDCNDGFRGNMEMDMSKLSMESFDADEELSDDEKAVPTSDSDGERDCFSLPATPPQAAKQRPSPRPEGLRERERGRGPERSCEAEEECTAVDGKCEQGREEGMG